MPQIGPLEILTIAAVALIVFGPQKLPEMARTFGRTIAQFRRVAAEVRAEFETDLGLDEDERVRPEEERPQPRRLTPQPFASSTEEAPPRDAPEDVLKPGEAGPGDDVEDTPDDERPAATRAASDTGETPHGTDDLPRAGER